MLYSDVLPLIPEMGIHTCIYYFMPAHTIPEINGRTYDAYIYMITEMWSAHSQAFRHVFYAVGECRRMSANFPDKRASTRDIMCARCSVLPDFPSCLYFMLVRVSKKVRDFSDSGLQDREAGRQRRCQFCYDTRQGQWLVSLMDCRCKGYTQVVGVKICVSAKEGTSIRIHPILAAY